MCGFSYFEMILISDLEVVGINGRLRYIIILEEIKSIVFVLLKWKEVYSVKGFDICVLIGVVFYFGWVFFEMIWMVEVVVVDMFGRLNFEL